MKSTTRLSGFWSCLCQEDTAGYYFMSLLSTLSTSSNSGLFAQHILDYFSLDLRLTGRRNVLTKKAVARCMYIFITPVLVNENSSYETNVENAESSSPKIPRGYTLDVQRAICIYLFLIAHLPPVPTPHSSVNFKSNVSRICIRESNRAAQATFTNHNQIK
jgi:hypothetical protein